MTDTVIRVEKLGKKYVIGHQQKKQQYTALRDVLANQAKSLGRRLNPFQSDVLGAGDRGSAQEEFWALKDVSFEIKQGDRVGIIGRNGAGKSTLLKLLSRITEPTEGRISLRGRVASLLEVGTGFHPELTGRENIYLNGTILGMGKAEIKRKFDEIVAFAEVEKFLDTPVKRYSSGMYVRLAFAVAAHLEPEILVVDEVLAVGDAEFQKKCLGKMEDISKGEGRTILFVSHNMDAIRTLCHRSLLINQGKVQCFGPVNEVISMYGNLNLSSSLSEVSSLDLSEHIRLNKFSYNFNLNGLEIHFSFGVNEKEITFFSTVLLIYTLTGTRIALIDLGQGQGKITLKKDENIEYTCKIPEINLVPGHYNLGFAIETADGWIDRYQILELSIEKSLTDTGDFNRFPAVIRGYLNPKYTFKSKVISRLECQA